MLVIVKTLDEDVFTIECSPDATIETVKSRIQDKQGVTPDKQRLIYAGKQLEDGTTLRQSSIGEGSILVAVYEMMGQGHEGPVVPKEEEATDDDGEQPAKKQRVAPTAAPKKVMRLPASATRVATSTAPTYPLSLLQLWVNSSNSRALKAFYRDVTSRGHFFVEADHVAFAALEGKRHRLAKKFFRLDAAVKREVQMADGLRVWGWKELDWKRKEMLKVRRVAMCNNALQRWEKPTRVSCKEVMDVYNAMCEPALVVARAVLLGMGMADADVTRILDQDKAPRQGSEQATSFFEMFKYHHFDFSETGEAAVPAEEHKDVGIVTVSSRGSTGQGLQAYDWHESQWVCLESRVMLHGQHNCFSVLFGSFLQSLSKGVVHATPHRVVLPNNTTSLSPRYSSIFEVLPNPDTNLPGLVTTGKKLFAANSVNVSSINFE
ncbi:Ubiquitin [Diplonema papillatum]|nr:Ubiquitin [Diplonema papillatum]